MNDKVDQQVKELFEIYAAKKTEIEKVERSQWVTNCAFRTNYFSSNANDIVNLHVADESVVVGLLGLLLKEEEFFKRAARELGSKKKFLWCGYSVEDWIKDFKTRISKLQIAEKKKTLKKLSEQLDGLLSPQARRELELQKAKELMDSL